MATVEEIVTNRIGSLVSQYEVHLANILVDSQSQLKDKDEQIRDLQNQVMTLTQRVHELESDVGNAPEQIIP